MEPVTFLGAAGSVAELVRTVINIGSVAKDLVQSFRNAPEELGRLANKLDVIGFQLDQIERFGTDIADANMDDYFPETYRAQFLASMQLQLASLNEISQLFPATSSLGVKDRLNWASMGKKRSGQILRQIQDSEDCLDGILMIISLRLQMLNKSSIGMVRASQQALLPELQASSNAILSHVRHIAQEYSAKMERDRMTDLANMESLRALRDLHIEQTKKMTESLTAITVVAGTSLSLLQSSSNRRLSRQHNLTRKRTSKQMPRATTYDVYKGNKSSYVSTRHYSQRGNYFLSLAAPRISRNYPETENQAVLSHQSWFGNLDTAHGLNYITQVQGEVHVMSKAHCRHLKAIVRMGLQIINRFLICFELDLQQAIGSWWNFPRVTVSLSAIRIRPRSSPIFLACQKGDLSMVQTILQNQEASIYDVDDVQHAGLLDHTMHGYTSATAELAVFLIHQGCRADTIHIVSDSESHIVTDDLWPALLKASFYGNTDITNLMLSRGFDVESVSTQWDPCLGLCHFDKTLLRHQLKVLDSLGLIQWNTPNSKTYHAIAGAAARAKDLQWLVFALEHIAITCLNDVRGILLQTIIADYVEGFVIILSYADAAQDGHTTTDDLQTLFGDSIRYGSDPISQWLLLRGISNLQVPAAGSPAAVETLRMVMVRVFLYLRFSQVERLLFHALLHGIEPFHRAGSYLDFPNSWTGLPNARAVETTQWLSWYDLDFKGNLKQSRWSSEENGLETRTVEVKWSLDGRIRHNLHPSGRGGGILGEGESNSTTATGDHSDEEHLPMGVGVGKSKEGGPAPAGSKIYGEEQDNQVPRIDWPTLFYDNIASASGRKQLSRYPLARALCNALQMAGYRADMDDNGEIWTEDGDENRYVDAREFQPPKGTRAAGMFADCCVCENPTKYGLGYLKRRERKALRQMREEQQRLRGKQRGPMDMFPTDS